MLGSNSKVWDLGPTLELWDSSVGFIKVYEVVLVVVDQLSIYDHFIQSFP